FRSGQSRAWDWPQMRALPELAPVGAPHPVTPISTPASRNAKNNRYISASDRERSVEMMCRPGFVSRGRRGRCLGTAAAPPVAAGVRRGHLTHIVLPITREVAP